MSEIMKIRPIRTDKDHRAALAEIPLEERERAEVVADGVRHGTNIGRLAASPRSTDG